MLRVNAWKWELYGHGRSSYAKRMKALLLTFLIAPTTLAGWEENQAKPLRGEMAFQDADLSDFLSLHPNAAVLVW